MSAGFLPIATGARPALPSPGTRYEGTLDDELSFDLTLLSVETLTQQPRRSRLRMRYHVPATARVFAGRLLIGTHVVRVVWVEPRDGDPIVYLDANLDGAATPSERFEFAAPRHKGTRGEIAVDLPMAQGRYPRLPMLVVRAPDDEEAADPHARLLLFSLAERVRGTVEAGGLRVLVDYELDINEGRVHPAHTSMKVDTNGDGRFDSAFMSAEIASARGRPVVFRVGDRYFSTEAVDLATGRFVLVERDRSDYVRIELEVGRELPDFAFADLEGVTHRLSEYRGRWVLLDFWTTTCGPCIGEFPNLRRAIGRFGSRGLEVVGVACDRESAPVRAAVRRYNVTWTVATPESTKELVQERLGIYAYPTLVLVDPEGRVASLDDPARPLGGEDLERTLEKLLSNRAP